MTAYLSKDMLVFLELGAREQLTDLGDIKHLVANGNTDARLGLSKTKQKARRAQV